MKETRILANRGAGKPGRLEESFRSYVISAPGSENPRLKRSIVVNHIPDQINAQHAALVRMVEIPRPVEEREHQQVIRIDGDGLSSSGRPVRIEADADVQRTVRHVQDQRFRCQAVPPVVLQPCSEFPLSFSYSDSTPGQYGRAPETWSTGLRSTRYPFPENPGCYNTMLGGCSIGPAGIYLSVSPLD